MTTKSLFHEQDEAETKILVDGVRLFAAHVNGFKKLRSVLGLSVDEARVAIEKYDSVDCLCAQATLGQVLPVSLGRLVNEKWRELTTER